MSKVEINDKDLEALGLDPKNIVPAAIPDNIAPKLKEALMQRYMDQQKKAGRAINSSFDLPTPEMRHNERVREREGVPTLGQDVEEAKSGAKSDQTDAASKSTTKK